MRIVFPTDEHRPYHDQQAVDLAMDIVSDYDPDLLVVGSDGMDFYGLSHFDKNPDRLKAGLQKEIDSWKAGQRGWRDAAKRAARMYIKGNHEDRLRKHLWRNPELYGLEALTLPKLLDLEGLGIFHNPEQTDEANTEVNINDLLLIRHGSCVKKISAWSARAEAEKEFYAVSTLTGHTHRGGSFYVTTRRGVVQAQEGFCLCRLDPEYTHHPNWQQGIVLAEVNGEAVTFEPILFQTIRDRKVARFREKEYST